MKKIIDKIKKAKKIAIFSHINPDPDALGSVVAMYHALKQLGKNPFIFLEEVPNEKFDFLDFSLFSYKINDFDFDLCVSVDCADSKRLGIFEEDFKKCDNVAIDHHSSRVSYANAEYVDGTKSSNCEILFELFQNLKVKITKEIATALYLGLSGDTCNFSVNSTNSASFDCASKLLKYGADFETVNQKTFLQRTFEETKLLSKFITSIQIENGVGIGLVLNKDKIECGCVSYNTSEFVNMIRYINGVKIAILIKQIGRGEYSVSLRSTTDFDVAILAGYFGGGGHKQAAGFTIKMGISKLKKQILAKAHEMVDKNENWWNCGFKQANWNEFNEGS